MTTLEEACNIARRFTNTRTGIMCGVTEFTDYYMFHQKIRDEIIPTLPFQISFNALYPGSPQILLRKSDKKMCEWYYAPWRSVLFECETKKLIQKNPSFGKVLKKYGEEDLKTMGLI